MELPTLINGKTKNYLHSTDLSTELEYGFDTYLIVFLL